MPDSLQMICNFSCSFICSFNNIIVVILVAFSNESMGFNRKLVTQEEIPHVH